MTSLSEAANDPAASPVRLFQRDRQANRVVSRLEFRAAREPAVEATTTMESESESAETELRLKEEMAALDARFQSQTERMLLQIEEARIEAKSEARRDWEEEFETKLVMEQKRVSQICEQFGRERTKYFADIEAEVVKLALAIAARVLHREAKLDPLLLVGVVRVALDKVADNSVTTLRVPSEEVIRWQGVFAANSSVQVIGDERLTSGDCVLDTSVGKVELGVNVQLSEIENGFFDLLQQRPA
jgi:flagellar assembly protein FliH